MAIAFYNILLSELVKYTAEVRESIEGVIDDVTDEAIEKLRTTSPKDTKKYSRSWTFRTTYKHGRYENIILSRKPHYRLTHLLEDGHKAVDGSKVKARPHIADVEDWACKEAERRIERILRK